MGDPLSHLAQPVRRWPCRVCQQYSRRPCLVLRHLYLRIQPEFRWRPQQIRHWDSPAGTKPPTQPAYYSSSTTPAISISDPGQTLASSMKSWVLEAPRKSPASEGGALGIAG